MDLINCYYPLTNYLLQETMEKEIIKGYGHIDMEYFNKYGTEYYNKYDSSYVEAMWIGPLKCGLLNGKPHGIIGGEDGCGHFIRGKLVKFTSRDMNYSGSKLEVRMYRFLDRYICYPNNQPRLFTFYIENDYLVNTDHPKNWLIRKEYKRYKLIYIIDAYCNVSIDFMGYN